MNSELFVVVHLCEPFCIARKQKKNIYFSYFQYTCFVQQKCVLRLHHSKSYLHVNPLTIPCAISILNKSSLCQTYQFTIVSRIFALVFIFIIYCIFISHFAFLIYTVFSIQVEKKSSCKLSVRWIEKQ